MTSIKTSYRNVKRNIGNFFYTGKLKVKHLFEKIFFPHGHKEELDPEKYIKKEKRKEKVQRYAFIIGSLAIPIASFLVFYVYVNFDSVLMAFRHDINGRTTYDWSNFQQIFNLFRNPDPRAPLGQSLINTLIYFGFDFLIVTPLTYLIAYFIYKKIKGATIFRYIFFLPSILPAVITSIIFKYMMGPFGPISAILTEMTGSDWQSGQVLLLNNSKTALPTLLLYRLWSAFGINLIYFTANLERIPKDIIESARLDGVGTWSEIRYILFPLTWPFFSTFMFLGLCGIFGHGGPTLLFYGTAGLGSYGTWDYPAWQFFQVDINYGTKANQYLCAAMGWLTTLVAAPISFLFHRIADKVEPVEY